MSTDVESIMVPVFLGNPFVFFCVQAVIATASIVYLVVNPAEHLGGQHIAGYLPSPG